MVLFISKRFPFFRLWGWYNVALTLTILRVMPERDSVNDFPSLQVTFQPSLRKLEGNVGKIFARIRSENASRGWSLKAERDGRSFARNGKLKMISFSKGKITLGSSSRGFRFMTQFCSIRPIYSCSRYLLFILSQVLFLRLLATRKCFEPNDNKLSPILAVELGGLSAF